MTDPVGGQREQRGGRARAVLAVVLVLGMLAGCTRLVLSQLDWLAVWYAGSYVTLDGPQKAIVRDGVRRNVVTFRREQLPDYLEVIAGLRADLGVASTAARVEQRFAELEALGRRTVDLLVPDAVALLRSLTPAQVEELYRSFAENAAELADDYSGTTIERRRERQARSVLKLTRRLTGSLSQAQEQVVREHLARLHDLAPQWLERRQGWQQALRTTLEGPRTPPEFDARVASLVLDPDQFDAPPYRRKVAENRAVVYAMVADLIASLTPTQRAHVDRRLAEYERNLLALATG